MKHLFLSFCLMLASLCACSAQTSGPSAASDFDLSEVVYTKADSALVCKLLRMDAGANDVLFFARQFLGLPYVAYTLEVADPEKLVVNLHGLDCTTYVETVLALTLTYREGSDRFSDYCRNLERIRYRGGVRDGYLSRLHYFAWWMHDNVDKGIVSEVKDRKHWDAPLTVNDYYMTKNWQQYRMLKAHPEWVPEITRMEKAANGRDGYYLPEKYLNLTKKDLGVIKDGDVIGIVTTKAGLDYSHLGFAVWGKDGKLHLLNASSLYKKVVEDSNTLYKYLGERKTSIGIRLLRLN